MTVDILRCRSEARGHGKRRTGDDAYQESLGESHGNLVFQVVGLATQLGIGRNAFLLKPFGPPVEDLEAGSSRSLDGVEAATSDGSTEGGSPWQGAQARAHCQKGPRACLHGTPSLQRRSAESGVGMISGGRGSSEKSLVGCNAKS